MEITEQLINEVIYHGIVSGILYTIFWLLVILFSSKLCISSLKKVLNKENVQVSPNIEEIKNIITLISSISGIVFGIVIEICLVVQTVMIIAAPHLYAYKELTGTLFE